MQLKYSLRSSAFLALMLCTVLNLGACVKQSVNNQKPKWQFQGRPVSAQADTRDLRLVGSIGLLPLQFGAQADVAQAQAPILEQVFEQTAQGSLNLKILRVSAKKTAPEPGGQAPYTALELKKIAASAKTDSLLALHVSRFKEREGSALGAQTPAEVAFSLSLYRSRDAKEIWTSSFSLKDQSLSENLMRLRDQFQTKPGWKSATDLLSSGLKAALAELERQRQESFLVQP
jgi:hypothetical protein